MSDLITIRKPFVPYGPDGIHPDDATSDYLLEAAGRVETNRYWGSNVSNTVVKLLRDAAAATRVTPLVGESHPTLPEYVYVASSWRNPLQPAVCAILGAAGIPHYDFRNPPGGSGFSWREVKTTDESAAMGICHHCGEEIARSSFTGLGFYEPDVDPDNDPVVWRHKRSGYGACRPMQADQYAIPKKGSDWEDVDEYLRMVNHPRAVEGYDADFAAMDKADTFVMVLPCGKSAHLEIGYAIGAGKRTAILLENPVEPELMYRGVDFMARNVHELLGWLGVQD